MESWRTIGHEQVKRLLGLQLQNGTTAQSYLFLGPEGVGKRLLAKEFASRMGASSNSLLEFDFATQGVEDLRELLSRIALRPFGGGSQVVILDGAEHMQASTSNALLKTLEEPSASTVLILLSSRTNVPATVVSRCQVVQFGKLTEPELRSVGAALHIAVDDALIQIAHGIPARLQSALSQNIAETKFIQWERELKELCTASVLVRIAILA
jgi:DNA polymerase III subunit delta'